MVSSAQGQNFQLLFGVLLLTVALPSASSVCTTVQFKAKDSVSGADLVGTYALYKSYPAAGGHVGCIGSACGEMVTEDIPEKTDVKLKAGDYLVVGTVSGYYTSYALTSVAVQDPAQDAIVQLSMVKQMAVGQDRVLLSWGSSEDRDLWVYDAPQRTTKVGYNARTKSMLGGQVTLDVDVQNGPGLETTNFQNLNTDGKVEVWVHLFLASQQYNPTNVAAAPSKVEVYCYRCLDDNNAVKIGFVTAVTQTVTEIPSDWAAAKYNYWKAGAFQAGDGLTERVKWTSCTGSTCWSAAAPVSARRRTLDLTQEKQEALPTVTMTPASTVQTNTPVTVQAVYRPSQVRQRRQVTPQGDTAFDACAPSADAVIATKAAEENTAEIIAAGDADKAEIIAAADADKIEILTVMKKAEAKAEDARMAILGLLIACLLALLLLLIMACLACRRGSSYEKVPMPQAASHSVAMYDFKPPSIDMHPIIHTTPPPGLVYTAPMPIIHTTPPPGLAYPAPMHIRPDPNSHFRETVFEGVPMEYHSNARMQIVGNHMEYDHPEESYRVHSRPTAPGYPPYEG